MKRALIVTASVIAGVLAVSSCGFAQGGGNAVFIANPAPPPGPNTIASFRLAPAPPVTGAPYSATITNESVQTLADGNRIVQTFTGNTARDSQGRTRQDAPLPPLGNLSAANAPHLVFIQDPVSQTSYTLNLTDKTAQKMPAPPPGGGGPGPSVNVAGTSSETSETSGPGGQGGPGPGKFFFQVAGGGPAGAMPPPMAIQTFVAGDDSAQVTTEDLGTQTMQGVSVTGVRTTRTIPAGQIGNDQPISVVTEVWTSADLKTVVYSKRSDPRLGDQTFQLTNIVRSEPDASLFTVPSDFKVIDGPQPIIYRANQ